MSKKIKLLFIHHKLVCGGAEQALFELINLLDREKFDITIFVEANGGEWESKFRNADIRIETEEICQKKSPNPLVKLNNWIQRKRIAQSYKKGGRGLLDVCYPNEKFDIIIAYQSWWKLEKCFRKNARTVLYVHGDVATLPDYLKHFHGIQHLIPKFDCIICVSELAKQSFCEYTGRTESVCALFNPLDSNRVQALAEESIELPLGGTIICAVGRLTAEKGFERLIRIHKNLIDKGYEHKLVIVGDGEGRGAIENVIVQTQTKESVILAGYQSNPYPYIKNCSFLVCPSYSEGLGMVGMEALCLGIPVVSSAPAVGELFGDEQCGIITGVDDAGLEAGIESVLSNQMYYQQLRDGARRRSAYFNGKTMAHNVERVFLNLVGSEGE